MKTEIFTLLCGLICGGAIGYSLGYIKGKQVTQALVKFAYLCGKYDMDPESLWDGDDQ